MTEFIDTELLGIGLALGLGLLIGIEREWEDKKPLGLRTFALLSVAGATSAVLAAQYSALICCSGSCGNGRETPTGAAAPQR